MLSCCSKAANVAETRIDNVSASSRMYAGHGNGHVEYFSVIRALLLTLYQAVATCTYQLCIPTQNMILPIISHNYICLHCPPLPGTSVLPLPSGRTACCRRGQPLRRSRLFEVTHFGTNYLPVNTADLHRISRHFRVIAENWLNYRFKALVLGESLNSHLRNFFVKKLQTRTSYLIPLGWAGCGLRPALRPLGRAQCATLILPLA